MSESFHWIHNFGGKCTCRMQFLSCFQGKFLYPMVVITNGIVQNSNFYILSICGLMKNELNFYCLSHDVQKKYFLRGKYERFQIFVLKNLTFL